MLMVSQASGRRRGDGGRGCRACGLGEQGAVGRGVGIDGDPELARAEVAQDGGHAAHVVGVGVGEGDDVEAAELARPEVGRDDLLADVEGGVIRSPGRGRFRRWRRHRWGRPRR